MGTSTVTIEGGAFVIRTGNLLTKFTSLESAAEQIALLHDVIGMRKLLLDAVDHMRRLQRDFFRTKRRDILEQSLQAERAVDALLDRLRGGQMGLFDES